ncbi:MAG: histidine phosphatase family protein, partial [Acidimicrobiales bacterium]
MGPLAPAPTRLLLVRHGQSTWNGEGRWQGWADPPLSPLGERQAVEAARRLAGLLSSFGLRHGFDGVVASDLVRARRTAEVLSDGLGLGPVAVDPGLRERDVGDWSGLTRAEIAARWPDELAFWLAGRLPVIPGGEPEDLFSDRALTAVRRLATEGRDLLVVTHGGLLRALDRSLGARVAPVPNLAGRWYEQGADGCLRPATQAVLGTLRAAIR